MTVFASRIARDVVTVSGPDAVDYLQGQVSQDVAGLALGDSEWTFVLQPQGKVDGWARATRLHDDAIRLDTDPGAGAALLARLQRFLLRTKADIELSEGVPVLAVRGATEPDAVDARWPGIIGSDRFDAAEAQPPAGATLLDPAGYERLRIRHGVPRAGVELTSDTIPAEVGQWVIDASVSFTKGCFTGQELVARIDSRGGNVPRHLRGVAASSDVPVGGDVVVDGKSVGRITSAAVGDTGAAVALAFVHRSVAPPAAATVDGLPVEIVTLPFPDAS